MGRCVLRGGELVRPQSGEGTRPVINSHQIGWGLKQTAQRLWVWPLPLPPIVTPSGGPGISPVARPPPAPSRPHRMRCSFWLLSLTSVQSFLSFSFTSSSPPTPSLPSPPSIISSFTISTSTVASSVCFFLLLFILPFLPRPLPPLPSPPPSAILHCLVYDNKIVTFLFISFLSFNPFIVIFKRQFRIQTLVLSSRHKLI